MWKRIIARKKRNRKLGAEERERVQDTMQLVESARASLSEVDTELIPEREAIDECFAMADRTLRQTLRSS